MATVRVTRPRTFRDALRAYWIEVDGDRVASIRPGRTAEITLSGGSHQLRAALSYLEGVVGSAPVSVTVAPDETLDFVVEPIGRLIVKPGDARGREESALELRHLPSER